MSRYEKGMCCLVVTTFGFIISLVIIIAIGIVLLVLLLTQPYKTGEIMTYQTYYYNVTNITFECCEYNFKLTCHNFISKLYFADYLDHNYSSYLTCEDNNSECINKLDKINDNISVNISICRNNLDIGSFDNNIICIEKSLSITIFILIGFFAFFTFLTVLFGMCWCTHFY